METKMEVVPKVPADVSIKLRALAHDLSNSLEAVMQASYLLSQTKLDEPSQKWVQLLEQASREAARINREIREVLRSNS
jgi:signal transduction histidine kinase